MTKETTEYWLTKDENGDCALWSTSFDPPKFIACSSLWESQELENNPIADDADVAGSVAKFLENELSFLAPCGIERISVTVESRLSFEVV